MGNYHREFFEKGREFTTTLPPLKHEERGFEVDTKIDNWWDLNKTVYIDTETTDGNGKGSTDAMDPNSNIAIVQTCINGKIEIRRWNQETIDWIKDLNAQGYTFVFHNAPFDLFFLRMKGGIVIDRVFDTQIASQVINAGKEKVDYATIISRRTEANSDEVMDIADNLFEDEESGDDEDIGSKTKKASFFSHSLGATAYRYAKVKMVKDLGNSDWSREELTPDQIRYAEEDVRHLERIVKNQLFVSKKYGMTKVLKLEMDLIPAVVDMRVQGILIDRENWMKAIKEYEEEYHKLEEELNYEIGLEMAEREDLGDSLFGVLPKEFSVSSNTQLKEFFKGELVDGKPIESVSEEILKNIKHPLIPKILRYKEVFKLATTYGVGYLKHIQPDGRIHAELKQVSNAQGKAIATGRFCVRKGSKVAVVNETSSDVKIEDIKVGDLVYTYDDNLNLTVRPVVNVWNTGVQEIVRVHWTSRGGKHSGYLDCTPEHRLRLASGEYVKVKDIKLNPRKYTRVLAFHRKIDKINGYSLVYQTGVKTPFREHVLVFRECNKINPQEGQHVHHKNENKLDNRPENLELLDGKVHTSFHSKKLHLDKNSPISVAARTNINKARDGYIKKAREFGIWRLELTQETLSDLLWKHEGRPTALRDKEGYDYKTIQRYMTRFNISWKEIRKAFKRGAKGKSLLNEDYIVRVISGEIPAKQSTLDCFERNYRGMHDNNHVITHIEYLGITDETFDIEVEETHNFIVNEICTHNSSASPNL